MLLKRKCPYQLLASFMQVNLIETISPNAKAFLKEEAINTFADIGKMNESILGKITDSSVRTEVKNLRSRISRFLKKEDQFIRYSKNIQQPPQTPRKEQRFVLAALIAFEPFLGNRREVTQTKQSHLPGLYVEQKNQKAKVLLLTKRRRVRLKVA